MSKLFVAALVAVALTALLTPGVQAKKAALEVVVLGSGGPRPFGRAGSS